MVNIFHSRVDIICQEWTGCCPNPFISFSGIFVVILIISVIDIKEFGILNAEDRLKHYRRYVYEAGAVNRSGKPTAGVINNSVLAKERKDKFELRRVQRFRYRTRYFTDSGIIGTKTYVSSNYRRFKDIFMSKREKAPKPVAGLKGVFSLKRLAE